jgi:hypothetical protein
MLLIAFAVLLTTSPASAEDLNKLLTGLYGGNGIQTDSVFSIHHAHFEEESLEALQSLTDVVGAGTGLLSINPSFQSVTFDVQTGLPLATAEQTGSLFAERASTIGEGAFNIAFSYSHTEFEQLNGDRLNNLNLKFPHEDVCDPITGGGFGDFGPCPTPGFPNFEKDFVSVAMDLSIEQDVFAFYGTYGITPRWDVGVVLPLVHVHEEVSADATVVDVDNDNPGLHVLGVPGADDPHSEASGDAFGPGDLLLRTKYNFVKGEPTLPDFAFVAQVTLPTGDEDNLLGTGELEIAPIFVVSKTIGIFTPHLNLGYEFSTGDFDNFRFAVGSDIAITSDLAAAFDVFGRSFQDRNLGDPVDAGLSVKWDPIGGVPFGLGIWTPINRNEGLRPDVGVVASVETTF